MDAGATKSGARADPVFAAAEKSGIVSSVIFIVPFESDAPTAMMSLVERRVGQRGRGSLGLVAAVAGGGHDDDAGVPRALDRVGQGIDAVATASSSCRTRG